MSLTAISSLESARRKFFMNSTFIMSTNRNHLFLAQDAKMSLTAKEGITCFWAQDAKMISSKISHELDVHHVESAR